MAYDLVILICINVACLEVKSQRNVLDLCVSHEFNHETFFKYERKFCLLTFIVQQQTSKERYV